MSDNTTTESNSDLSIDQRLALKTAATRLQSEFADMFGVRNHRPISAFVVRPIR